MQRIPVVVVLPFLLRTSLSVFFTNIKQKTNKFAFPKGIRS